MKRGRLLIEIGAEEIPARMIRAAARDFAEGVAGWLEAEGLAPGTPEIWGGSRRLAFRLECGERQADREEVVTGPPVSAAYDADGRPTPAAVGFARKQGVPPDRLERHETERGTYLGLTRHVEGRDVEEVLAEVVPAHVESMHFPKMMRWGDGALRWVRPVHWVLARFDERPLTFALLGVRSGGDSVGHRFLSDGAIAVPHASDYEARLEQAHVVVARDARRERLAGEMNTLAASVDGVPVEDAALLDEVADLVEWPGIVLGGFDAGYLKLPRELLITTLRHHQKCFSIRNREGELLPFFLAVANTDRDPGGHVRRGNEWVIGGRLEDARFFWSEDRKRPLAARAEELGRVILHADLGSYRDKSERMSRLATVLAERVGLSADVAHAAARAAAVAKNDLVSGTVGEFPELQGQVGGLLLRAEGAEEAVALAVYEHYRPVGPTDEIPASAAGAVVAAADKLDSVTEFVRSGRGPTGSKDPFGLRRAGNGLLRICLEKRWPLSIGDLAGISGAPAEIRPFVRERLTSLFRDQGFAPNEIASVLRPRLAPEAFEEWPLHGLLDRLQAIRNVRDRRDFRQLVQLTDRVDSILSRNAEHLEPKLPAATGSRLSGVAATLDEHLRRVQPTLAAHADAGEYAPIVDLLGALVEPVDRFFEEVLVIDEADLAGTASRWGLLKELRGTLTAYFDIRELSGQADRRR